jgi:hypothetical protein
MTDEELKSLVRDAVARHLAGHPRDPQDGPAVANPAAHPGFHRYALPRGSETDGSCLIEPAVRCTHCGYCQSHGY